MKKEVRFGGINFGAVSGQGVGYVQGNQKYPSMPGTQTHHSNFSSSYTAAYGVAPPPYHPPAYAYGGGGGYPPPYHHPLGHGPPMQQSYSAWRNEVVEDNIKEAILKGELAKQERKAAAEAAAACNDDDDEEEHKLPPKTKAAEPKPKPVAATATHPPRKEPLPPPAAAADGYPGWDVAGGDYPPPPQYGYYPPRHAGGGYPVQGYPTHHGYGHGGGYNDDYGYGYGAPPQHMGRRAAGAAAVHEAYGYRHGVYGHHGKFKQGHQGKYSHYYGPHRSGKFAVS